MSQWQTFFLKSCDLPLPPLPKWFAKLSSKFVIGLFRVFETYEVCLKNSKTEITKYFS